MLVIAGLLGRGADTGDNLCFSRRTKKVNFMELSLFLGRDVFRLNRFAFIIVCIINAIRKLERGTAIGSHLVSGLR
jgi:hypothetical protein